MTDSNQEDVILSTNAYFGRLGCDAPYLLVETAMKHMSQNNPDLDFILVPGDLVGHSISIDQKDDAGLTHEQRQERYKQLMDVHE